MMVSVLDSYRGTSVGTLVRRNLSHFILFLLVFFRRDSNPWSFLLGEV